MPPSKHRSGLEFAVSKTEKGLVVEPKIRALRNDYAETKLRENELISRFRALAEDCEHRTSVARPFYKVDAAYPFHWCKHKKYVPGECSIHHCPFIRKK